MLTSANDDSHLSLKTFTKQNSILWKNVGKIFSSSNKSLKEYNCQYTYVVICN